MQLSLFENVPQQFLSADEMFDALDENNLRRWIENNRIEKKSALAQPVLLGEYFSMWANTPPDGGMIICGVSTDKRFEGCLKVGIPKMNDIERTGVLYCPDSEFKFKQINIHRDKDGEEDFVLAIRVKYHPT